MCVGRGVYAHLQCPLEYCALPNGSGESGTGMSVSKACHSFSQHTEEEKGHCTPHGGDTFTGSTWWSETPFPALTRVVLLVSRLAALRN